MSPTRVHGTSSGGSVTRDAPVPTDADEETTAATTPKSAMTDAVARLTLIEDTPSAAATHLAGAGRSRSSVDRRGAVLPRKIIMAAKQPDFPRRWSQPGSNRRPSGCQPDALPAELWPQGSQVYPRTHDPSPNGCGASG